MIFASELLNQPVGIPERIANSTGIPRRICRGISWGISGIIPEGIFLESMEKVQVESLELFQERAREEF